MVVSDMSTTMASSISVTNRARKPEQVLLIEPQKAIHFKGPYKDIVTSHIQLTNPTDQTVWFKVKTTAPRRYCVRPNNGFLSPGENIKIAVMLQPFDFDNVNENRNKHKFMIQTMFEPEPDPDPETMWRNFPEEIMDSKLKCVFDNDMQTSKSTSGVAQSVSPSVDSYPSSSEPKTAETYTNEGYVNDSYKHAEDEIPDVKLRQLIEENKSLKEENQSLLKQLVESPSNVLRKRNTSSEPVRTSHTTISEMSGGDSMRILVEQPQYLIIMILITLVIGVFTGKFFF